MTSFVKTIFQLGYEISPIILNNGIADLIPGKMLPIVAITEFANFTSALIGGNLDLSLDNYFAHFKPLPGSELINNEIADYPFANLTVAANSIIARPLPISLIMNCPAKSEGDYVLKLATMTALKKVLDQHNQSGGTYTVATPSYIYTNCLLKNLRDVSAQSTQVQTAWQWDFEQPLLTQSQANATQMVLNSVMSKISGGLPL